MLKPAIRSSVVLIYCVKKRPKRISTPENGEPAPPRILDTSQLTLRRQLALVQRRQDTAPKQPAVKTAFRRKKASVEERAEQAAEDAKRAREAKVPRRPGLASIYYTREDPHPSPLLVDGYNVIGRWKSLCELKTRQSSPVPKLQPGLTFEQARELFINEMVGYSIWRGVKVLLAFDSKGATDHNAPGQSNREMVGGIEVVYNHDADHFLIREGQLFRALGAPKVLVVSDDMEVRTSCFGQEIWPQAAFTLLRDMNKSEKEFRQQEKVLRLQKGHTNLLGEAVASQPDNVYKRLGLEQRGHW
ncbi:hypothetical protein WJX73_007674 [Symbiochloris irregularis]|uniref:Uncharacterized protein n=1 Tax=Symbiochloris irregularis TaxID=706552 RepID=A0AAW1P2R9_9CHLO